MNEEKLPFIRELCSIAHKRNEINTRRHRARFRKNYYENAIRVVEAFNQSNAQVRRLDREERWLAFQLTPSAKKKLEAAKLSIRKDMQAIRNRYINHKKPLKWQTMGLHKLRSLSLKAEGEYALAKHETMELSLSTTPRVKELLAKAGATMHYENGAAFFQVKHDFTFTTLSIEDVSKYAAEYEVEKMLQE